MNTTTTEILPGMTVLTASGRFVHVAKSTATTVCGKPITRAYPTVGPDCHVCQRRPGRR